MRFSFTTGATALAAVMLLASSATAFNADNNLVAKAALLSSKDAPIAVVEEAYTLKRRQEHDHDHPTTSIAPVAPINTTPSAPLPTVPAHDEHAGHDHDHEDEHAGHDHDHEDEHAGHDHGSESSHSHGPARTCEVEDHNHGEYIVWHHIVALLVLIVIAGLGCVIPMIIPDSPRTRFAVQCGKYFGAGVVLSVAFIHIMPEALFTLTHPCLSKAFTEDFPGYAPLIMMFSGLAMLVIEFMASSLVFKLDAQKKSDAAMAASGNDLESAVHAHDSDHKEHHRKAEEVGHESDASINSNSAAVARNLSSEGDDCNHAHGLAFFQGGPGVSTKVSTYMLEMGIALHSVFIGIALGVLSGSEFLAMTIAICFHQFFEGIALGSRIADLTFRKRWMPMILVLIFALVTPLGVAIGMGMRTSYKANSVENLIAMGVCDSIACGVLLYTAFVTLLGGDILYSNRFRAESRANKASYLIAVWLGAIAMAVLALWA
ncbi:high-affinity Zn(2+) transporter zrt1 [Mortierella polycephala]|uniref:High-affinity Zn(2+) transporter zrt1 n=1 Tax=Mortierella polycephala TaxID=41804 RepID=A0A9P6Q299_9FUNG|nr:high-affinity Zn(2+) transporter zrt1 [Mortierella polycephala]